MAKVIDALVVTLGLDPSGYKKGAAEANAAQAGLKKTSEADAKTYWFSADQGGKSAKKLGTERRKEDTEERKRQRQREREARESQTKEAKNAEATIGRLKSIGLAAAGAVLGFSTIKGAIEAYLGATNQLANLGRVAPTIGTDVKALDVLGDAYKQVGGKAEEAGSDIAKLAHAQFSFAINAPDALAGWARRLGVSLFNDNGTTRDKVQVQQDIAKALQRQTSDLQTQAMYAREMGMSESFIQLYLVKNAAERAKILKDAEATAKASEASAKAAISEEQARARLKNTVKGAGQKVVGAIAPTVANVENVVADTLQQGNLSSPVSTVISLIKAGVKRKKEERYSTQFNAAEKKYGLPAGILADVAHAESNFNPKAISSAGAVGLMQLMPGTFKGAGKNTNQDIDTAAKELKRLLDVYRKTLPEAQALDAALKAYNGGQGNVDKLLKGKDPYNNGGKLLPETAAYANRVLAYSGQVSEATAPLAGPGASKNSRIDRSNTSTTHVETVNINTTPENVPRIVANLPAATSRQSVVNQANSGMR